MGLNLETLIGILVILILLILADGIRRMLRERGGRLKVRIDPQVREIPDDPGSSKNSELPGGGARVVSRSAPTAQKVTEKKTISGKAEPEKNIPKRNVPKKDVPPPVVMEAEETQPEIAEVTQQDLFSASDEGKGDAAQSLHKDILEVIVLHMVANDGVKIPGRDLLQKLLELGMRFGEMNIFHRHAQGSASSNQLFFSMANALEPGTFDIDTMEKETFRAVTFFMKLPGPSKTMDAFEKMLSTAKSLAEAVNAELRDEQHSVLTPQRIEHLRQRVQDFERRQRIADAQ